MLIADDSLRHWCRRLSNSIE